MGQMSAEQFAQRAFDLGLLTDRQLQEAWASFGTRNLEVSEFVQYLVGGEYLTNYQVDKILKGDKSGFFYGEYKVLYLVGTGTFARVFRAAHRQTGQVVALKVLRRRYSDTPAQYEAFLREGRVGLTLRHPNIVPIYEVISEGHTHYLVMEFVEGQNLRDFVKIRGRLSPEEATRLMCDIASGLQYAFEHGLTHRDLKMTNVLISSEGRAKLVDFGLAAVDEMANDDLLSEFSNPRTIDYAGLERATGVRKDDTRSDIYFAGCIYYHMLTGQAPLLETKDRLQRLSKQRFLDVPPIQKVLPDLPSSVTLVVNKAMSLDVERRYQTPGAFLVDLKITAKRLREESQRGAKASDSGSKEASPASPTHTVMVVESNSHMQDLFREQLKKAGYRVLLTSDPERALDRFRDEPDTAECVILNAQQIGRTALEVFNVLGQEEKTQHLPAILLLDEKQQSWIPEAMTGTHRLVLQMPLTVRQLRQAIAQLLSKGVPTDSQATDPLNAG